MSIASPSEACTVKKARQWRLSFVRLLELPAPDVVGGHVVETRSELMHLLRYLVGVISSDG
jgi:hypothetical protein